MIILLTGERGSGKTTVCQRWAYQARVAGWDVAGLLSPAVFDKGRKVAIDAFDLRSGERRRLAWTRTSAASAEALCTLAWCFDPATVAWGNQVLASATPCDLLIVDELGPLELEHNQGWTAGIAAVNTNCYRQAWVVVRRELLGIAQRLWPTGEVVEVADASRWTWPFPLRR
ncbi:MAG: nucleoside-triphosphatase [Anaerolineae bacterium]|nr:nucleoside-triphosphatase [Anaerolineae bacterium]